MIERKDATSGATLKLYGKALKQVIELKQIRERKETRIVPVAEMVRDIIAEKYERDMKKEESE